MKKFKYIMKRIGDWLMFVLTIKGEIAKEAVKAGICDFSVRQAQSLNQL